MINFPMVINPPLLLVSALFFLALSTALYVGSWLTATLILRFGRARISHAAAKRILMTALVLPPIMAAIPTVSGATLKHSHITPSAEHHSMACQQAYSHFMYLTSLHGSVAAGVAMNGLAWLTALLGVSLVIRLLVATTRLERGLAPYLSGPSEKLTRVLTVVSERMPRLRTGQFYECAIPAASSSVFGFLRVRCVLSRDFVQAATDEELVAVVAHEASHLRSNDVWATLLVGALNCLYFAVRPVRLLTRRWREAAELACDDAAVKVTHNPLAMASAILRVSGVAVASEHAHHALPATTLAFADEAACAPGKRVERLIAQAQNSLMPAATEAPMQAAAGWAITLLLAGMGGAVLFSAGTVCYAHCSLEVVARLLP